MSEWIEGAPWDCARPMSVRGDERIEYQLMDDDEVRFARAGELAWGGFGADAGQVRIARWRRVQAVGDVNGATKGSGARFNAEKPDLSLIPAGIMAACLTGRGHWTAGLRLLGDFQMRKAGREALLAALVTLDHDGEMWSECARVFSYGKEKYAAWNWARGMAWSIPLACALRHIVLGTMRDERIDPESGLPHRGHIACNVVMLLWFIDYYPEGDDRPTLP